MSILTSTAAATAAGTKKKVIAGVLSLSMALTCMGQGVPAFADTTESQTRAALEAAQEKVVQTKDAWDEAKVRLSAAEKVKDEASAAVSEAEKPYNEAREAAIGIAKKEVSAAEDILSEKKQIFKDKKAIADSAYEVYQAAKRESEAASSVYISAHVAISEAQTQMNLARNELREVEEEVAKAKKAQADPGRYFLAKQASSASATVSVDVLTNLFKENPGLYQYIGTATYDKIVSEALSEENLLAAAALVKKGNNYREAKGKTPLMMNYRLMCLSITSMAVSAQTQAHTVVPLWMNNNFPDMTKALMPRYPSENLSFAYDDPFEGWYEEEGSVYNTLLSSGSYPGLDDMTGVQIQALHPEVFSQAGHYINLMDKSFTITGFAYSGNKCEQTYAYGDYGANVTPDQFVAAFNGYKNQVAADVAGGQARITAAEDAFAAAKKAYDDAVDARHEALLVYEEKGRITTKAKEDYDAVEQDMEAAEFQMQKAEDAVTAAKAINIDKPDTYKDFPAVKEAVKAVTSAAGILAQKEKELSDATEAYDKSLSECTAAENAYNKALKEEAEAQKTLDYVLHKIAGHTWDAGKITKKPTITATGVRTFTCTECGDIKTESVAKLPKKVNPLAVKGKTAVVSAVKVKKAAQFVKVSKAINFVNKGKGALTYSKVSGNKNILVSKKTGKITVKKGLKKGLYTIKVKVKAAGNSTYKAGTKEVKVKIRVK